jgi:alkylation response protein AidB-like acyl-CoA dehydrogenase
VVATAFPRVYGGTEARMLLRVRIIEELGSVCTTAASLITGTDLSSRPIVAGGSDEIKADVLPDLASGVRQSAFALTEPGAGSDVARLATRYVRTADGFALTGERSSSPAPRWPTCWWWWRGSKTGPPALAGSVPFWCRVPHRGSTFRPRCPRRGGTVCRLPWSGWTAPPLVPASCWAPKGRAWPWRKDTLLRARIGHAAIALGRARGALQIATQYAAQREVFGHAVGAHQGIQWMVADMAARIEAARCMVYSAAVRYDAGDKEASVHASMAKMHVTDLCMRIVVDALQIMGGNGYLKAFPLERFMRDAKMNQIGEGTSEIHKNLIGRHVMAEAAALPQHPCLDMEPDLFCGGDAA